MGTLCVMGPVGDTKLIWNPNNTDEVDNARRSFDDLRKKGYLAYRVSADGSKGEVMTAFDPHAEKVILAPPMRGG
jgi:hypothetical protein